MYKGWLTIFFIHIKKKMRPYNIHQIEYPSIPSSWEGVCKFQPQLRGLSHRAPG